MAVIFDIKGKAQELGISKDIYKKLEKEVRQEFPNDEMMFELHLIRVLKSYSRKKVRN